MKIPSLIVLCLAALASGSGHIYPSAPAQGHHRHLAGHGIAASYAYFQNDPKPVYQQTAFVAPGGAISEPHQGSFAAASNFRNLPFASINSFHGLPPLVPVSQEHGGLRKHQRPLTPERPWDHSTFQKHRHHWSSGATFERPQPLTPASFGTPGDIARPLAPAITYQNRLSSVPTTFVGPASVSATHKQPLGPLTAYQSPQPLVTSFGAHQKQHLGPLTTVQGPHPLDPTPFGGFVHQRPLGPLTAYQSTHPLAPTAHVVAPGSVSVHQQPLTHSGPFSSQTLRQPLTPGSPFSDTAQKQPQVPTTAFAAPFQKQPLAPSTGFAAPFQKQPLAPSTGFAAPFQKQPLTPSTANHGQQAVLAEAKSPKGPVTPAPKKSFSFSYTANPLRKVVEVSPQRGVISGTVPYPVVVQTASGPKYGTYHQPTALSYTYNATKIHYKPVEAHGYQVSY